MLAAGLCDRLALLDANPVAVAAARDTVRRNGLDAVVTVHCGDSVTVLPDDALFDLVVASPPHCPDTTLSPGGHTKLIYNDLGWETHRRFYGEISSHLANGGRVLLQEDASQSSIDDFTTMIENGSLDVVGSHLCLWARQHYPSLGTRMYPEYYYVESQLSPSNDTAP